VTGSVYPEVEKKLPQYPYKTRRVLFRNLGNGTFEELETQGGEGISAAHSSRGCAFGDFDNDGDIDVLIVNMNEPPSLLRNDLTGKQNWLKVKLEGVKSNRSAIGARVIAHYAGKSHAQALVSQSSYYSCNDPRLHFGLGAAMEAALDVYWPNGLHESYPRVAINRLVTIREGAGVIPNRGWSR
jgi:enediyne biosynthesis protein E4